MATERTSSDLETGCIHIWRIDLDRPSDELHALLSADEIKRAAGLKQTQTQGRFIRGRGAMRAILGDYLSIPGNELKFIQQEKGKPSLAFPDSGIEFNLSHCEGIALLAVAKQIPLGIDLELVRPRPSQLKIAQRMFPGPIFKELKELPSEQLAAPFFQHWTELEARAKCVGYGIFSPEDGRSDITTRHFFPEDGWIACIATMGADVSTLRLNHFVYRN